MDMRAALSAGNRFVHDFVCGCNALPSRIFAVSLKPALA
jgi:hypothetical protein